MAQIHEPSKLEMTLSRRCNITVSTTMVDGKGPRKNKFIFYGAGVLAAGEA